MLQRSLHFAAKQSVSTSAFRVLRYCYNCLVVGIQLSFLVLLSLSADFSLGLLCIAVLVDILLRNSILTFITSSLLVLFRLFLSLLLSPSQATLFQSWGIQSLWDESESVQPIILRSLNVSLPLLIFTLSALHFLLHRYLVTTRKSVFQAILPRSSRFQLQVFSSLSFLLDSFLHHVAGLLCLCFTRYSFRAWFLFLPLRATSDYNACVQQTE